MHRHRHFLSGPPEPEQCPGRPGHPGEHKNLPGRYQTRNQGTQSYTADPKNDLQDLDSGIEANGILEVMPDGFGFIRCENFLPGDNDVYVAPSQIRRFNMKTGDIIRGSRRVKSATEKFAALLYVKTINATRQVSWNAART